MSTSIDNDLTRKIARIHARVLAAVLATIFGVGLFTMTAWLLLKGDPEPGPHLQLLGQYLLGYSVTWPGSIVGFLYGVLIGGVVGWFIGTVYNRIARPSAKTSNQ